MFLASQATRDDGFQNDRNKTEAQLSQSSTEVIIPNSIHTFHSDFGFRYILNAKVESTLQKWGTATTFR